MNFHGMLTHTCNLQCMYTHANPHAYTHTHLHVHTHTCKPTHTAYCCELIYAYQNCCELIYAYQNDSTASEENTNDI